MSQQCLGFNTRGLRCKRQVSSGSYCVYHKRRLESTPQVLAIGDIYQEVINDGKYVNYSSRTHDELVLLIHQLKLERHLTLSTPMGILAKVDEYLITPNNKYEEEDYSTHELLEIINYMNIQTKATTNKELLTIIDCFRHEGSFVTPTTLYTNSRYMTFDKCCVCFDVMNPKDSLYCQHNVCYDCTHQLRSASCPLCRRILEGPLITQQLLRKIKKQTVKDNNTRNEHLFMEFHTQSTFLDALSQWITYGVGH